MKLKPVSAESIADILMGRAGLIVGPGATVNSGLYSSLAKSFGIQNSHLVSDIKALGTALRGMNAPEEELKEKLRDQYGTEAPSPYLQTLAKPNWKAVISLAIDSYLEDRIQIELDKKPSRRPMTIVTDLSMPIPPRSTPVFKLLGSVSSTDFALYEDEYLSSRVFWRNALTAFCETLAGSPVFCIGVDGDATAFLELVSEMLGSSSVRPSSLIFMKDCPLVNNRTLHGILKNRLPLYAFQDSLSALVSRLSSQEVVSRTPMLRLSDGKESALERYNDVCVVVKVPDPSRVASVPREMLLDSLFSPSIPDWAPYSIGLDFRRELENEIIESIKKCIRETPNGQGCVAITGSAANGKTTVLKRVAFELASVGRPVIWLTAAPLSAPQRFFHEFFRDFRNEFPDTKEVILFIDDPIRSRSGEIHGILNSSAAAGLGIVLVIAVRSSEWSTIDVTEIVGHAVNVSEVVLHDNFTLKEIARLPTYLCGLSLAQSESDAKKILEQAGTSKTQDVLNTFFVAVPHTRSVIVSSVRDEYCRLGDLGGLRNAVKQLYENNSKVVRQAYELTAVANAYGCDLPFELLRSAIGFEWSEAKDFLATNSAMWGILYMIESGDDLSLRARNQVVTDTVVSLVNGGAHSKLGEIRILHALIGAASGKSRLPYRSFIAKLLIGNERLNQLTYDDGRELYVSAISSLPTPDRVLVHHQGIWEDRHNHAAEALQFYHQALKTPNYPYTERSESQSNIYTSMASAVLSQIKAGEKDLSAGRAEAEELLDKARKESFGDAHQVHVSAGISLELVKALGADALAEKLKITCAAVAEIDKIAILGDSPVSFKTKSKKSEGLLLNAKEQLYGATLPLVDGDKMAEEVWLKSKSQDGFVVVARKQLSEAREAYKGKKFKDVYEYIIACRQRVLKEGRYIDKRLFEIQAEVIYWWRIHRAMLSPIDIEIDWSELLGVLNELDSHEVRGQNTFFHFLKGISLAHLGDWDAANQVFMRLRQSDLPPGVLWLPRAFLLNQKGGRTTVQGIVREHGGRVYLEVEKPRQNFAVDKKDRWCSPGETDHANIMFCFGGFRAVHDS